jgi:tripeptide aminopeptidase
MDTAPSAPGKDIKPRLVEYDGGDLVLNEALGIVMKEEDYDCLRRDRGKTLVVTDGTTLLGSDDKAGVAEIVTALQYLVDHPEVKHGRLAIAFTPDEEIGRGADCFDVEKFGAAFAYTVDGGELGEIEYENFNGAVARITVHGLNIHPGSAKGKMKNALLIAMELNGMLPPAQTPAHTEGYDGFYHLCGLSGEESEARMEYIIRDHHRQRFEEKKNRMEMVCRYLNEVYGRGTVELTLRDQYYNMKEKIEPHMHLIRRAEEAFRQVGVEPKVVPIRGGTDGARLSYMGLPCPNLSTGGQNFHGPMEYIPVASLETMVNMLVRLAATEG